MSETPLAGAVLSMLIGLLLGLERESSQRGGEGLFAGIRSFPILALCGFLGAQATSPLVLPAVLLAIGALVVASYLRTAGDHVGATTEIVAILTPLLGALVAWKQVALAASLAVLVTLLLTLKGPLHRLAGSVTGVEIVSVLKVGIVAVVLLPLLPSDAVGPYAAIVPRHVGFVVVIVSGVSLVGYVLVRVLGGRTGWALAGSLGGLVSSTAVTLSFAGKARAVPELASQLADGIVLASTVLYLRALVLTLLFDRALGLHLAPRLAALLLLGLVFALVRLRRGETREPGAAGLGNPVELGRAVTLGLIFAAILLGARAAEAELGERGLWAASALGGLVDVDSVAVAAARLRQQGIATVETAAGSVLLATLANLLVKGGIVLSVGGRPLARRVLPAFATLAAVTLALLALG